MELIDRIKTELNVSETGDVALLENCLWQAQEAVKEKRCSDNIAKYDYITFQIAVRLWNIRGVEGQSAHSENGINRTYMSDGVISEQLKRVPSLAVAGD